jgi:hypothetical protein
MPKSKVKKALKKAIVKAVVKKAVKNKKRITGHGDYDILDALGGTGDTIRGAAAVLGPVGNLVGGISRGVKLGKTLINGTPNEGSGFVNKAVTRGATALGDLLAPGLGDFLGKGASSLAKWIGFGDYRLKSNTMLTGCGRPNFTSRPGSIRFAWTEFVNPITYTSSNFSLQNYLLNPGNPTLFPFLSTIATNFENFEFHGLIMHYDSTSSVAFSGNSPAVGQVTMATDYDVIDANYAGIREMEVTLFATTEAPFDDQYHAIECKRGKNVMSNMYVQPYSQVSQFPDDPRFSCLGNFQLATTGIPYPGSGAPVIGNLYVTYDVTLAKPQIATDATASFSQHMTVNNNANVWGGFQLVAVNPAGSPTMTFSVTGTGTGSQMTVTVPAGQPFIGQYVISVQGLSNTNFNGSLPVTGFGSNGSVTIKANPTFANALSYTAGMSTYGGGAAGYGWSTTVIWNVTSTTGGGLVIPVPTTASGTLNFDIYIAQIASGLTTKRTNKNKYQLKIDEQEEKLQEIRNQISTFMSLKNDKGVSPVVVSTSGIYEVEDEDECQIEGPKQVEGIKRSPEMDFSQSESISTSSCESVLINTNDYPLVVDSPVQDLEMFRARRKVDLKHANHARVACASIDHDDDSVSCEWCNVMLPLLVRRQFKNGK